MSKVRCPWSRDEVDVERSPTPDRPGDAWACTDCNEDIVLESNGRLHHAPGKWRKCPVNREDVFVWTKEDEDFECDGCGGTITVRNGAVDHEPFPLVRCPAFDDTSLVFLGEDEEYECDHCGASISVANGNAEHAEVREIHCERYPDKTVVVEIATDEALECPHCGADIASLDGVAVHATRETRGSGPGQGQPAEVFLSYKRDDADLVRPWVAKLRARGVRLWLDEDEIDGATLYSAVIVDNIKRAKVVMVAATKRAYASPHVAREITIAAADDKPILPVHFAPIGPDDIPKGIAYFLAGIQHIAIYNRDPADALNRILRSLGQNGVRYSA